MLKTVSSITNAIGALNYKGTWNANTNTPALASSVGIKGDYYVVGVAGTTALDGISNWGVGDWVTFNGSVWQRVEGGADLNGVNLSVSGTTNLAALTASTALALDANKNVVSVSNTGTGDNVLATAPTLVGDVTLSTGNLVMGTSGKGIDFSATPGAGTSELFDDYEEGTWTPEYTPQTGAFTAITYGFRSARYVKIGDLVYVSWRMRTSGITVGTASGTVSISGLPFVSGDMAVDFAFGIGIDFAVNNGRSGRISGTTSIIEIQQFANNLTIQVTDLSTGAANNFTAGFVCYRVT